MSGQKPDPSKIANIGKNLQDLQIKAANLMKITQESEQFAKRKQGCFLDMLGLIENLAATPRLGIPVMSTLDGFIKDANSILTKYQDDLGKEKEF